MNTGEVKTSSGVLLGCDSRQGVLLIWDCYGALQLLPVHVEQRQWEPQRIWQVSSCLQWASVWQRHPELGSGWDGWTGTGTSQPSPVSTHQPCFYLWWWRAKFWGGSSWDEWTILGESPHWWLVTAASPPQGPLGSLHPPGSICLDNAELGQESLFPSVQMAATASLAAHQMTEETPAPLSYCWQGLQITTQHKHTSCKQPEK